MGPTKAARVVIHPDHFIRHMLTFMAVLIAASCAGQISKYFLGHDHLFGLVRLTYLNGEATIPSWYASSALLICALALAIVAMTKRSAGERDGFYWTGLAVIFTYLSVDEAAGIHELWGAPIEERFAPGGYLAFAWVIPATAVVAAVGFTYLRFVWRLPAVTRRLFVLAAALFVGSAVGVEMLGANHLDAVGERDFSYVLLVTLEETGEMLAVVLFLYSVLRHLRTECGVARLEVSLADAAEAAVLTPSTTTGDLRMPAANYAAARLKAE